MNVREIRRGIEINDGYTNERSLGKLMIDRVDNINESLTYLWGKDSGKFPLTTMTEGQVGGVKEINGVEYKWKTMGRARHADQIVRYDSTDPNPGYAGKFIIVYFKSRLIIEQYGLIAPDGLTKARVMAKPEKQSDGSFKYILQLKNPSASCPIDNLRPGKWWVMTAPTIPESFSRGNRSNARGTGEMHNQIGFHRYSKHIGGNLANKVVDVTFELDNGGKTKLWIGEEMRQFEIDMRQYNEEHLWTSEYNRLANGEIIMKDLDNDEPIPEGAGVFEMVKEVNYDTYGEVLTIQKLNSTINAVFDKDTDTEAMEIVLYAGRGFGEDFHRAIVSDIQGNGFQQALGEKLISGSGNNLSYGGKFTQYVNLRGDRITIKPLNMLDVGLLAENDKLNGNIHPRTGYPMSSHVGIFLDQSIYGGERNVRMVRQTGQADIFKIVAGLAPIPPSWGMVPSNLASNDVDASSYERKRSIGINIANTTSCFMLQSVR